MMMMMTKRCCVLHCSKIAAVTQKESLDTHKSSMTSPAKSSTSP